MMLVISGDGGFADELTMTPLALRFDS